MVTLRMGNTKVSNEIPKSPSKDLEFLESFWMTSGSKKIKMDKFRCKETGKIVHKLAKV